MRHIGVSGTYTLGTRESATRRGRAFFFITRLRGLSRAVTRGSRSSSGFLWPTGFVVVNGGGEMPAPLCLFFNELEDGNVSACTYMIEIKKRTENSEKIIEPTSGLSTSSTIPSHGHRQGLNRKAGPVWRRSHCSPHTHSLPSPNQFTKQFDFSAPHFRLHTTSHTDSLHTPTQRR